MVLSSSVAQVVALLLMLPSRFTQRPLQSLWAQTVGNPGRRAPQVGMHMLYPEINDKQAGFWKTGAKMEQLWESCVAICWK